MAKTPDMTTIGGRIATARKSKYPRMTQQELAEACGWEHQSRVSAYELDNREPTLDEIGLLANVLGVSHAWLATGEGEMDQQPTRQLQMPGVPGEETDEGRLLRLFKALDPERGRRFEVLGFLQRKLREEGLEIRTEGKEAGNQKQAGSK